MGITDVHQLKARKGFEGQNVYFYNNHPIRFLCLAGIIVARDEFVGRTILVLDDSTGATIEVVCDKPDSAAAETSPAVTNAAAAKPLTSISDRILNAEEQQHQDSQHVSAATRNPLDITPLVPGTIAKLRGTISVFHGHYQLRLERYTLLPDTNAEVGFWESRTRFLVDVLSVPWVLTEEDIERLRRTCEEDEGRDARRMAAKRKKVERAERKAVEREERDRARIERRYEREEVVRRRLAEECAVVSRGVGKRRRKI
jgi:hypothetical protein